GFPEMVDVIERCKQDGVSKKEVLLQLAGVEGVYVPTLYRSKYSANGIFNGMEPVNEQAPFPVQSRIVESLKPEYYPDKPLVPLCEIVHDRLAVEIMRGCSHGCRFCEAGMSYRPRRVRPVSDVVNHVVKGILTTGWDEVSLVSLSTTDYPGIEKVVQQAGSQLKSKAVSISLSSLRADNFSLKMAEATAGGRKTGLTFAVEAGTQRLRDVINKNLTEEQLLKTVESALTHEFSKIKLYFMIGLPTETDEDVLAIAELLNKLSALSKRFKGRHINVTVSPFAPKPLTPFQWENQDSADTIARKTRLVKNNLRSRFINIKEGSPLQALLEARFGRGGRELGAVILNAWKRGSKLNGWSEHFDGKIWLDVFRDAGIALEEGGGGVEPGTVLPWSHLHFGVDESFLHAEREKAFQGITTPACDRICHSCGMYAPFCNSLKKASGENSVQKPVQEKPSAPSMMYGRKKKPVPGKSATSILPGTRMRLQYTKNSANRFTGHLDIVRVFDRTFRRAGIPVAYSQGFHPHPSISFGHPLPLGIKSRAEYADFSLSIPFTGIEAALQKGFPDGFHLVKIRSIPDNAKSLSSIVSLAEYFVRCEVNDTLITNISDILKCESIPVKRITKKGEKIVDIRSGIVEISIADDRSGFNMLLSLDSRQQARPSELLELISADGRLNDVTRTEQYAVSQGKKISPMEII
ncbi:MAG: DUF2344 domain-containing protein, partial [Candidatus Latescibacteria bacterium]|nr:DUF2344 domain-containing protein [Candidatus Latescibacterota bacterium]